MKTKIIKGLRHGKPVLRCIARIEKSKKIGIPRTYQKTWVAPFVEERCIYDKHGVADLFKAEARRWQLKTMQKIFGPEKAEGLIQQEIQSNNEQKETSESDHQHSKDNPGSGGEDAGHSG